MNYNISAYIVFIALMVFIILFVGKYFYTNGRVFIISLLKGNVSLADSINRLLLAGYYLVNIGYAFLKIKDWKKINTMEAWCSSMALNMGTLIVILAMMHYLNMLSIYYLSKTNSLTINRINHE